MQAIREGVVPPNAGTVEGDPALELPLIRRGALEVAGIRAAGVYDFAFGGNNTALVFSVDGGGA